MRGPEMVVKQRRGTLLVSTLVGGVFFRLGDSAFAADPTYRFDIPREPLSQALTDFSQASAQQIIYSESIVKGHTAAGLHGSYTVDDAIHTLLNGTDLKVDVNPAGVLMIRSKTVESTRTATPAPVQAPAATDPTLQRTAYQAPIAETQSAPPTASDTTPTAEAPSGADQLATVVVTGSTSNRTLRAASVAVTSISSNDIDQKAPRNTADVLNLVPGIFVESTAGPVSNNYSVRGSPGAG